MGKMIPNVQSFPASRNFIQWAKEHIKSGKMRLYNRKLIQK